MKIGIILSNTDPEIVWNALRFANTALLEEHIITNGNKLGYFLFAVGDSSP